MRCEHEHDDGAYVLGALAPAERAAYERHLATCSFCREAVAEIAVLPGLLGRLDAADFAKLLDPTLSPPPPVNRTPRPVGAMQSTRRRERKTMRVRILSTAMAAAVLALIVGIGVVFVMDDGASAPGAPAIAMQPIAMQPVDATVPVTAHLSLAGANGGTKVELVCFYNRTSPEQKPYTIRLLAYGADDEQEQIGSWVAAPGKEFKMSGVTHFTGGTLSRLELVRNDGKALLVYNVP
jgi:hypothetical protein